jgi:hypothetical protein
MIFSSDVTPVALGGVVAFRCKRGKGYCTKRGTSKFDNYQKRERGYFALSTPPSGVSIEQCKGAIGLSVVTDVEKGCKAA